jgi:putative tail protein
MPSSVVKEQIYKLKLDAADLQQKLQNAIKDVGNFQQKMDSINGKSVDNVEKSTGSLSSKLAGLVSHVPILGNIVEKMTGVGNASNTAASAVGRVGENAGSGFGAIQSGASNAKNSMEQLGSGVEGVKGKFSMLEGIATVALGNIASRAITAGASLLNKWTLAPIVQGYQEYERELDSTRILVAALGKEEQDHITATMRDLEQYAKTTKYNSQQMNSALAQFVNAGIDLDKANVALRGFGNLAASAGASTAQFGTALQFGVQQALQMGYMNRQNWMSLESAQLATKGYKDAVIQAAIAQGTLTQEQVDAVGVQGLFVEHLKDGWLTNEVLMQSLEEYANNPVYQEMAEHVYTFKEAMETTEEAVNDAWSKMWVELAGKGDEAMAIWTPVSEVLSKTVSFIPNMIAQIAHAFNQLDGRTHLISAIVELFESLKLAGQGVKNAILAMIPESSIFRQWAENGDKSNMVFVKIAETIIKITDYLKELFHVGEGIRPEVTLAIHNIVEVFIRLWGVVKMVVKGIAAALDVIIPDNMIQDLILIAGMVANVFNGIGRIFVGIKSQMDSSGLVNAFLTIRDAIKTFYDAVTVTLAGIWGRIDGPMDAFFDKVGVSIGKFLKDVGKMFGFGKDPNAENSLSLLERMANAFKNITDKFLAWAMAFKQGPKPGETDKIALAFSKAGDAVQWFLDVIKLLLTPLQLVWDTLKGFFDVLKSSFDMPISDKLGSLSSILKTVKEDIKEVFENGLFGGKASADELGDGVDKQEEKLTFMQRTQKHLSKAMKDAGGAVKDYTKYLSEATSVSDLFGRIIGSIGNGVKKLGSGIVGLVTGGFDKLKTSAGDSNTVLGKIFDTISKWHIVDRLKESFSTLGTVFDGFWGAVKQAFSNIDFSSKTALIKSGIEGIGNLLEWLADRFKTVSDVGGRVFTYLAEFFDTVGHGLQGNTAIKLAGFFLLFKQLQKFKDSNLIQNILHPIKALKEAIFGIGDSNSILSQLSGTLGAFQKNIKANTLKTIGMAMLEFAGALFVVSLIPGDKLLQSVGAVAAMATILVGAYMMIQKAKSYGPRVSAADQASGILSQLLEEMGFPEVRKLLKKMASATMMISLASSVMILGNLFMKLGNMEWEKALKSMKIMGMIMLELVGATWLSGFSGATIGTAATMWVIASTVKKLLGIIDDLNKIDNKQLDNGMAKLEKVAVVIGSIMALMGFKVGAGIKVGPQFQLGLEASTGNQTLGTAATLYVLMSRFKQLLSALDIFSSTASPEEIAAKKKSIEYGITALKAVMRSLEEFMLTVGATFAVGVDGSANGAKVGGKSLGMASGMGGLKVTTGNTKWSTVGVLLSLILGLKQLVGVIERLGEIDKGKIEQGSKTLKTLALTIAGLFAAVEFMSGAMSAKLSIPGKARFGIGGGKGASWQVVALMGEVIIGLILLSRTVAKLAEVDKTGLEEGRRTLVWIAGVIAGVFSAIFYVINKFSDGNQLQRSNKGRVKEAALLLAVEIGGLILLAGTVSKLGQELNVEQMGIGLAVVTTISVLLSGVFAAIGGIIIAMQKANVKKSSITAAVATLVVIVGSIWLLSEQIKMLTEVDQGSMLAASTALLMIGVTLAALEGTVIGLSKLITNMKDVGRILVSLGTMVTLVYVLKEASLALFELADLPVDGIRAGGESLSILGIVLAVMTATVIGMSKLVTNIKSVGGIIVVLGTMTAIMFILKEFSKSVIPLADIETGALNSAVTAIAVLAVVLTATTAIIGVLGALAGNTGPMTLLGIIVMIPLVMSIAWSLKQMGETVALLGGLSVSDLFKGGVAIAALGQVLFIITTEMGVLALLAGWSFGALWGVIPVIALILTIVPALKGMGDIVIALAPLSIGDLMSGAVAILALGVILVVITALATVVSIFASVAGFGVATTIALANGIIQALQSLATVAIGLIPFVGWDLAASVMVIAGLALILGALSAFMSLMSNVTSLEGAAGQVMIMQGITTAIQSLASTAIGIAGVGDIETMTKAGQIVAKLGDVIGWNTLKTAFGSLISGGADKISGQLASMKGIVTNVKDLADVAIKISASGSPEDMQKSADVVKKLANVLTSNLFKEDFLSVFSDGSGAVTRIKNGAKALASVSDASKSASSMKSIDVEGVSDKMDDMKTIMNKAKSMGDSAPSEQAVTNMSNMNSIINKVKDIATNLQSMPAVGPEATVAVDNIIATINSISTKLQSMEMNQSFEAAGLGNIGSYATGIQNGLGNVTGSVDGVVSGARGRFGSANMTSQGNNTSSTFGRGISALLGMVSGAASGVVNGAKSMFGQNDVTGHGNKMSGTFKGGIDQGRNPVSNAAKSVLDAAKSAMTPDGGVISKLTHAGTSMVDAIASGIRSAIGKATSAISDLWATVKAHIPNSPAKKGPMSGAGWRKVEHSGKTIVETIASGMGSAAPTVIDAMDNLMGEIQNQVDRVNDMDYNNMDINPRIQPILDMSQVETSALQAVTDYSGLLTGQTALNLQYSLLNPQVAQMLTNSDNINTLIGKVETLNGQMGELNVVNQEQAGLLREGQVLNTYIDGKRINNVLAPGMADAQLQYKARQDRINGGIA